MIRLAIRLFCTCLCHFLIDVQYVENNHRLLLTPPQVLNFIKPPKKRIVRTHDLKSANIIGTSVVNACFISIGNVHTLLIVLFKI